MNNGLKIGEYYRYGGSQRFKLKGPDPENSEKVLLVKPFRMTFPRMKSKKNRPAPKEETFSVFAEALIEQNGVSLLESTRRYLTPK